MSRSRRYPMCVMSNQIDKDKAHRRVRKHVKQTLQTMDLDDIPVIDIEADTWSIGAEEWGTKFGYDFLGSLDEEERAELEEDRRRASRK